MHRILTLIIMAAFITVGLPATASAHVELVESEPADGATLATAPAEVYLRFSGPVRNGSFTIRVRAPSGEQVAAGKAQSGARAAAVDLESLTAHGRYRVRYRGTAVDGHDLEGRITFRLQLPATGTAPSETPLSTPEPVATPPSPIATEPANEPTGGQDPPPGRTWWPFAALAAVGFAVGGWVRRRRR